MSSNESSPRTIDCTSEARPFPGIRIKSIRVGLNLMVAAAVTASIIFLESRIPTEDPTRFLSLFIIFTPISIILYLSLAIDERIQAKRFFSFLTPYLIVSGLSTFWGLNQLGGYDLSPLIDLIWRYQQGQTPTSDFISTMPTAILSISRLIQAVRLGSWIGMLLIGFLFTVSAVYASGRLFHALLPSHHSLRHFLLIGISVPWVATTHIWHSSISAQAGSIALLSVAVFVSRRTPAHAFLAGLTVGLSACLKQNVAVVIAPAAVILIFVAARNWRTRICFLFGASATYLILHAFAKVSPTYSISLIPHFWQERERRLMIIPPGQNDLTSLVSLHATWILLPIFLLGATAIFMHQTLLSSRSYVLVSGLIGLCAWFVAIATNWDTHWNSFPLFATALCLLVSGLNLSRVRDLESWSRILSLCSILVLAAALSVGFARTRMSKVGPLFEDAPLMMIEDGFLRGMRIPPRAMEVLDSESELARAQCQLESTTIFGPRIEFLYAQWGFGSPIDLPLWWHPGSSFFSQKDIPRIEAAFLRLGEFRLVTLGDDLTRMPDFITAQALDQEPIATAGPLEVRCLQL